MKILIQILAIAFFVFTFSTSHSRTDSAAAQKMSAEKWKEDLHFMVSEMQKVHVNIFHTMSKDELDRAANVLESKIPALSENQILIEFLKIITMIGDGHTYLIPNQIHMFPIKLYKFDDGVFVIRAPSGHTELAGLKLVSIGKYKWGQIIEMIKDILPRDNDMWIDNLGPTYAVIGEFMNGLGVMDYEGVAGFVFEDKSGNQTKVSLESKSVDKDEYFHSVHIGDEQGPGTPLYRQQPEKFYWLKYLDDSKILYVKYNVVQFDRDESMNEFCKRIEEIVNSKEVEKVIIDVRNNGGGNNFTSLPFVEYLSNNDKINVYGKLYTILGRQTFSAASFFTTAMENRTQTIFVGEPTGATPNHYGDNRPVALPNSGLTPRFSSIYWQNSFPSDKRKSTEPDIKVTLTSSDFFSKRDPVFEAIANHKADIRKYEKLSSANLKKYSGRYEFSPDQVLTIKEHNGNMILEITNFYKTVLYPYKENIFKTSRENVEVTIDKSGNGINIEARGNKQLYKRLPEGKYLATELLDMDRYTEAVALLRELKRNFPDRRSVSEINMNILGYELLNKKKTEAAIEIFKLNVELYPDAFNTYDSLGEIYMITGNTELAIINYEKSVELNPKNENAVKTIAKLKSKTQN